jgi:hypothetical protein
VLEVARRQWILFMVVLRFFYEKLGEICLASILHAGHN